MSIRVDPGVISRPTVSSPAPPFYVRKLQS